MNTQKIRQKITENEVLISTIEAQLSALDENDRKSSPLNAVKTRAKNAIKRYKAQLPNEQMPVKIDTDVAELLGASLPEPVKADTIKPLRAVRIGDHDLVTFVTKAVKIIDAQQPKDFTDQADYNTKMAAMIEAIAETIVAASVLRFDGDDATADAQAHPVDVTLSSLIKDNEDNEDSGN